MNNTRSSISCVTMRCDLDHQFKNHLWCLFPRVHCECGYRKLINGSQESIDNVDQNARIPFYIHDFKWVAMDVECQVSATTLCEILAKKNGIPEDPKWCIVEYFRGRNLRRVLEDSDDVLRSHEELIDFSNGTGKMYFEYIGNKELMYIPEKLLDRPYCWFEEQTLGSDYFTNANKFCFIVQGDESITMVTDCWYKTPHKNIWNKAYVLLQNGYLKLVNREIAVKIIKYNKPLLCDIEKQLFDTSEDDAIAEREYITATIPCPYEWISKSSSSPLQSKPCIKNPTGFNAKELKVYTHFEDPQDTNPPNNHIIILIERVNEPEVCSAPPPSDDSANTTESEDSPTLKPAKSKRNLLKWSSTLKARLVGRKKGKEGIAESPSCSHEYTSSDDDVRCNGAKTKKESKEKKKMRCRALNGFDSQYRREHMRLHDCSGTDELLYIEEVTENVGYKYKISNLAFDTGDLLRMWIDVLRYTKNGNFLRMNSNSFYIRQKEIEEEQAKKRLAKRRDYFVNMDFTGAEGRIVEEPEPEIKPEPEPMPSTSRQSPPPDDDIYKRECEWFKEFTKEPFEPYERQLMPCKRQSKLPTNSQDIQNIIKEEETYVEMTSSPRSILKTCKSGEQKKKVVFDL